MQQEDNNDVIQSIKQEQEIFISHINEIENIRSIYDIEDMGNESLEQEYLMYIEDHCSELRDLINKLYHTKLYIVKNNPTGIYRDKIGI